MKKIALEKAWNFIIFWHNAVIFETEWMTDRGPYWLGMCFFRRYTRAEAPCYNTMLNENFLRVSTNFLYVSSNIIF